MRPAHDGCDLCSFSLLVETYYYYYLVVSHSWKLRRTYHIFTDLYSSGNLPLLDLAHDGPVLSALSLFFFFVD
jgi:hypothetical protein